MRDIRNLNIWKQEPKKEQLRDRYMNTDISELCLSTRSYNCLKRAGCNNIGDVIRYLGDDGSGLKTIRNLGIRSEKEILYSLKEYERENGGYVGAENEAGSFPRIIIPGARVRNKRIEEFSIKPSAKKHLISCGIKTVEDLYDTRGVITDPGWFVVRSLFREIQKM